MKVNIISLFPELFAEIVKVGVVGRAFRNRIWSLELVNPRQFSTNRYGSIDDRPYGGGAGMVMSYEPLKRSLCSLHSKVAALETLNHSPPTSHSKVFCLSPSGVRLTQAKIEEYAQLQEMTLVCGRYEGIDQRFIDAYVDEEVSVGDFILSGGEPVALCLIDAVVRLLPQVLNNDASLVQESYSDKWDGLLDYPHYTRPEKIEGRSVPSVLLQGNHSEIQRWRRQMSLKRTYERRPDLMSAVSMAEYEKIVHTSN